MKTMLEDMVYVSLGGIILSLAIVGLDEVLRALS